MNLIENWKYDFYWICDFVKSRKYRVKVKISYSGWSEVTNGIPQGSILGPLLFLIYIDGLIDCCSTYLEVFADDVNIYRNILSVEDNKILQCALDVLQTWTEKWLLNVYLYHMEDLLINNINILCNMHDCNKHTIPLKEEIKC